MLGERQVAVPGTRLQIPVNLQRPSSSAYARTAPITCRLDGFTSARPATSTVGTVSFPSATERTSALPGLSSQAHCRQRR